MAGTVSGRSQNSDRVSYTLDRLFFHRSGKTGIKFQFSAATLRSQVITRRFAGQSQVTFGTQRAVQVVSMFKAAWDHDYLLKILDSLFLLAIAITG
jgi:hypothetical protein